ncbi:MAG: histidine triad nucleotide-binding protein [Simkaniaceae bacterium]|nr:histidine triad nucleotide-binding protein [Simkaniaceae bacterium]
MSETIFGKIIRGEVPSEKLYESAHLIAIRDINPKAPVHLLIIPKKAYPSLQAIPKEEVSIVEEVVLVAQELARSTGIEDNYRFITNNGPGAGQTVFHLHFHLIGGAPLGEMA